MDTINQRKTEEAISKAKEFTQLWLKFSQIYKKAMGKSSITPEEEDTFLETKSIIARKFQTLSELSSIDRLTIDRTYEVLNHILSLTSISTLSEEELERINNSWHESYISLNRLLGHLEAQKDFSRQKRADAGMPVKKSVTVVIGIVAMLLVAVYIMYILGIFNLPSE